MLRILHVGNFALKRFGRLAYNFERRVHYGLLRCGYSAYEFSDKDMVKFSAPLHIEPLGVGAMNRRLLETVENFRPDLLLLSNARQIPNATLDAARAVRPGLVVACYTCDPLFSVGNRAHQVQRLVACDALFVTTGGEPLAELAREGPAPVHYLPNPTDPSIDALDNFVRDDLPCDLLFFGSEAADTPRTRFIETLAAELTDVDFRIYGMLGRPFIDGHRYLDALASAKAGLSLNKHEQPLYSSYRIAELMGNGLLCYIHRASGLEQFFGSDGALYFSDRDELARHVRAIAGDDARRREIAANGTSYYREHFSSEKVARFVVETAMRMTPSEDYVWPTEAAL